MSINKSKLAAIAIALFLIISIGASTTLIPSTSAHNPGWNIPTHAFIVAEPNPIGVGQNLHIYMWLAEVYGAAGGTTAAIGTNASTASAALFANSYRFQNYKLTITAPDGTTSTQTFAITSDTTSSQYTTYTPTQTGTYTFNFTFPGQTYGANGNGYEKSPLIGDTYLASGASATLTVQQNPISAPVTSYPLPAQYWSRPIYGENTDWWSISSNWLGTSAPTLSGYTSSSLYVPDGIGPQTSHIMWTRPLQFGGAVGGNQFPAGGSDPNGAGYGVGYFEGSSYAPRFINPIIMGGYLYYTEVASFTGSDIMGSTATGPTICLDLRTGQQIWSNINIPRLSFGYIYNLWDPDQHGVYPPLLVASIGGGFTGLPAMWELFDAYTGDPMFNVTNVPSGTTVAGPSGEQIKYVFANAGTVAVPNWYLAEWNSSKLWQYDVNPYTGGGSLSPSIINASNGALIQVLPIPITGETGTLPLAATNPTSPLANIFTPYGSSLTVNANIPLNSTTAFGGVTAGSGSTTYDWNISVPWINNMPLQPGYNLTSGLPIPAAPGTNPVRVVAASYGDVMLCENGTLPTGFGATRTGYPQLPWTMFEVNLNASRGTVGSILWMQNYNPPPSNLTLVQGPVDFQKRVVIFSYQETMQWIAYSLDTGNFLWGPTASQAPFDYYGNPGTTTLPGQLAYGTLYVSSFSGICYAYNDLTGALLWTYGNGGEGNSTNAGLNVFYGDYPTQIQRIGNGIVYLATDEHTVPNPIYKGGMATAINATTGQEIWQLSDYPSEWSAPGLQFAIADGFLTCMNGYDQQVYSIGRGPSAITVTAPDSGVSFGTPVVIKGTVMDVSSGTKQATRAADFPNDVPVASDASMKDWMGYVYQQKPLPTNFTGVQVTVDVLDSNGNYRNIGTATTDATGMYSLAWTPNISGNYTVIATFHGTNGYWPSYSENTFAVTNAPSSTNAPTPTPVSTADQYFLPVSIAIIIVIVIVGAVLALLMLRKRP